MKTVRRPPYPKWNPGYFPCSSLTPLPLSSRRPSVSFGGFGLTKNPARDRWPDWSSDGTKIAFMFNRDGNDDMYIMNADGSSQTNLTEAGRGSEPQPFRGDDFEPGDLSKCVSVTMA